MEFDWDENKSESNIEKHGIDFSEAMYIWEGPLYEKPDSRDYDGEARFNAFGMLDNRVLAVAFTWRGEVCRIISARKANKRERRAYHAALSGVAPNP